LACLLSSIYSQRKSNNRSYVYELYTSSEAEGAEGSYNLKYISCIIEPDLINAYRDSLGPNACTTASKRLDVCSKNLTVAFSESPPLIYTDKSDGGEVKGILRGTNLLILNPKIF
jgi:hypothetical protein